MGPKEGMLDNVKDSDWKKVGESTHERWTINPNTLDREDVNGLRALLSLSLLARDGQRTHPALPSVYFSRDGTWIFFLSKEGVHILF